jgi:N6-L-threonylcarbamoyladenine synthase
MKILAIESSCDETSASVLDNTQVLSNVISSQIFHGKYGGVVPELASRAHNQIISQVTLESLEKANTTIDEITAIAVTTEPGLIGSLIVGSNFAKGLAIKYNLPIVPINHIEGHLFSGCIEDPEIEFPFITLVVSGGHTVLFYVESYNKYSILGLTKDDAAGEAFDKTAKLLGLTYPGGPLIDKFAKLGNPAKYDFPRSMMHSPDYNFSFSGLKTSVRYYVQKTYPNGIPEEDIPDICASVQAAIVDVLVFKAIKAAKEYKVKHIVIAGGVSANSGLRIKLADAAEKIGKKMVAPNMSLCMDNAAMIGFLAQKRIEEKGLDSFKNLNFTVNSTALRAKR